MIGEVVIGLFVIVFVGLFIIFKVLDSTPTNTMNSNLELDMLSEKCPIKRQEAMLTVIKNQYEDVTTSLSETESLYHDLERKQRSIEGKIAANKQSIRDYSDAQLDRTVQRMAEATLVLQNEHDSLDSQIKVLSQTIDKLKNVLSNTELKISSYESKINILKNTVAVNNVTRQLSTVDLNGVDVNSNSIDDLIDINEAEQELSSLDSQQVDGIEHRKIDNLIKSIREAE